MQTATIIDELKAKTSGVGVVRFVATHPDDDHIMGLRSLDDALHILNLYCVENQATKDDPTEDFDRYCELRDDASKAFYIYAGCKRKWMNMSSDERGSSGINILWPDRTDENFVKALEDAADGKSPNNISPIIKYGVQDGPTVL